MAPASADDDDRKQTINLAKSILLKALLATSVVVAGAKIKALALPSTTADGRPRRAVAPFTKPGDGWPSKLSKSHLAQLDDGKKVLLAGREANAGGGRGTAVCDVAAPPDSCWQAILGFERYAGRLAQCSSSSVYDRKKNVMARSETIKVHMKLAGGVKTFNCFYDHTYRPDKNMVTWTLDPDKKSDFLDVQGQWCVYKHPTKKNWSRVWYSADVVLPPWLPRIVVVQLCKTSGTKALQFAKKEAEAVYKSSSRFRGGFRLPSSLAPTPKMAHLR